jgi:hypothetical protein
MNEIYENHEPPIKTSLVPRNSNKLWFVEINPRRILTKGNHALLTMGLGSYPEIQIIGIRSAFVEKIPSLPSLVDG